MATSPIDLLRAMGSASGDAGTEVSIEGSTPPELSSSDLILLSPGELEPRTRPSNNAAIAVLAADSAPNGPIVLIADDLTTDLLSRLCKESVVLYHAGKFNYGAETVDVYQAALLEEAVATPAQLAYAIAEDKAELVKYAYTRSSIQERKTIETNSNVGLGSSRSVPDGPCHVTYKWTASTIKLSFRRDPVPSAPLTGKPTAPTKPKPAADAPDTLVMRDGRFIPGRVVSENGAEVVFVVVVGGIESEQRFLRHEIKEVRRGK